MKEYVYIQKIDNIEHGKIKVDDSIYDVPQFLINHIKLYENAMVDFKKTTMDYQEKLSRRNMQIKDLKKQVGDLEIALQTMQGAYKGLKEE